MRTTDRLVTVAVLVLVALSCVAFAQEKSASVVLPRVDTAPVITTEQAQAVRIAMQDITIARLQLDKAQADFAALMQSLQRPGYQIVQGQDGKLVYQPIPPELPKAPEVKK